jgi:hypothetical protein
VKIAAVPEQVDHDPGSLPVPEMTGSADHLLHLQPLRLLEAHDPRCAKQRAVSLRPAALQGWGQQVCPTATGRQ